MTQGDQIREWFEQHPEVLCELCDTNQATTFLEVWYSRIRPFDFDDYTAMCNECLPTVLSVPNPPWQETDH